LRSVWCLDGAACISDCDSAKDEQACVGIVCADGSSWYEEWILINAVDLALLTISRFILLDSMLLYFTALSAFCLVTFRNFQKTAPFSDGWWFWLAATGVSIGCVTSIKWVGLFAIALVGLNTIQDLWDMFGDLKMPKVFSISYLS
jgi:dolichyl-phosphate-mannose--protein O-mannosyl transferase